MKLRTVCFAPVALAALAGCATQDPAADAPLPIEYRQVSLPAIDTPQEMEATCESEDAALRAHLAALESFDGTPTIEGYYRSLDSLSASMVNIYLWANNLSRLATDPALRAAGEACAQRLARIESAISLSRPIYEQVSRIDLGSADPATRHSVEKLLLQFRLSGVDKDEETRARIRALNDEIVAIGQAFGRNIAEDVRYLELDSVEQLAGLPQDYIEARPPGEDGKIRISTAYPDVFPLLEYAEDADVRRRMLTIFGSRGYPQNEEVLRALIEKRHELAGLAGFSTWAELVTADKMIGSAGRIGEFIGELADYTGPAQDREYAQLLERLRQDDPGAQRIEAWDATYIRSKVQREQYDVDSRVVRQYFSYEATKEGILGLVQDLFELRIEPWQTDTWHESVEAYELFLGEQSLGHFYLDMHPREGKYQHAAMFPFVLGVDGRQQPLAALVCNFPEGDQLMQHGQVETFLHEFGHLVHYLLAGQHPWMNLGSSHVEWDFIEAPSQMLEEWVWDYETISSFAKNAEGETLPRALHERMVAARDFGLGMGTRRQLSFAAISLRMYDRPPAEVDFEVTVSDAAAEFTRFQPVEGTHVWANFGHLNGYSAIYYTYQWSAAISTDLFSRFEAAGLRDPGTARAYRDLVLRPGSTKPAGDLVTDFLGRELSFQAYADRLKRAGQAAE